jgi:hypothetical protein
MYLGDLTYMLKRLLPERRLPTPFVGQTAVIHGGDYNPDQWLSTVPDILEKDAAVMQATGINSSSVAIFAWTSLEPEEGKFTFDWLDRTMDAQAKIGNRVILATLSGAMPAWLADKYPDARRVDRRGFRSHYGNRHNHCWSSPSFHERVRVINSMLAERYRDHPSLAVWHVSNKLSGDCFCDRCRAAWAQWLERALRHVETDGRRALGVLLVAPGDRLAPSRADRWGDGRRGARLAPLHESTTHRLVLVRGERPAAHHARRSDHHELHDHVSRA